MSSADMPMVSRLLELRGPGQGCAEEASSRFLSRSSRVPQGLIVFPQPRSGRQERGVEGRGDTGEGTMAVAGLGSRNHALRALAGTPRPALGKQPLFVAPPSTSLLEASVAQGGQQAARGAPARQPAQAGAFTAPSAPRAGAAGGSRVRVCLRHTNRKGKRGQTWRRVRPPQPTFPRAQVGGFAPALHVLKQTSVTGSSEPLPPAQAVRGLRDAMLRSRMSVWLRYHSDGEGTDA